MRRELRTVKRRLLQRCDSRTLLHSNALFFMLELPLQVGTQTSHLQLERHDRLDERLLCRVLGPRVESLDVQRLVRARHARRRHKALLDSQRERRGKPHLSTRRSARSILFTEQLPRVHGKARLRRVGRIGLEGRAAWRDHGRCRRGGRRDGRCIRTGQERSLGRLDGRGRTRWAGGRHGRGTRRHWRTGWRGGRWRVLRRGRERRALRHGRRGRQGLRHRYGLGRRP